MALTTHNVLRDYLAVKHGGKTECRLPNGLIIDVLIKGNDAPDRLIEVKGVDLAPSQAKQAVGQLLEYWHFYKAQHPDRQAVAEMHWILPRNAIAKAAEQKRLAQMTVSPLWRDVIIRPVDDRPVPFAYQLEHMTFTSDAIAGDIGDYCRDVEQCWKECGIIRDEDRAALLTLARATWPSVVAIDLDRCVWFTLDGHAEPVTKGWGALVKRWIAQVHYRWWTTAILDGVSSTCAGVGC